jgi:hypothetical protein
MGRHYTVPLHSTQGQVWVRHCCAARLARSLQELSESSAVCGVAQRPHPGSLPLATIIENRLLKPRQCKLTILCCSVRYVQYPVDGSWEDEDLVFDATKDEWEWPSDAAFASVEPKTQVEQQDDDETTATTTVDLPAADEGQNTPMHKLGTTVQVRSLILVRAVNAHAAGVLNGVWCLRRVRSWWFV